MNSFAKHTGDTSGMLPRWKGQKGRLEVWYATVSDPDNQIGFWIHHEMVAPLESRAYVHGWIGVFYHDSPPEVERFGRSYPDYFPAEVQDPKAALFSCKEVEFGQGWMRGNTQNITWDLEFQDATNPLFTFPRIAWERELLPAAQIVPAPAGLFTGEVNTAAKRFLFEKALGGVAHIYGHGNALRWVWLHANLNSTDVLEIVSAKSNSFSSLPLMGFVKLRIGNLEWPENTLLSALKFHTKLKFPDFELTGTVGRRRIRVQVHIPLQNAVALSYTDPDGETATCTNSEIADAVIVLEKKYRSWETEANWCLKGTAHAEIGTRP
ncbi:MAG: hypothetical protein M1483_04755 [Actinobacteria bacterium]|nr:hypothetical protein [Actinomycetota bacterium]MCL6104923.1 hypothetical protein [Actinomycetota bacterium]